MTNAAHESFPQNSQNPPASSYSSISAILKLISSRQQNLDGYANIGGLVRAFSYPSTKFKGSGSESENLGTYHQQFMNVCKTFNLTEGEAFYNLYILFETGSEAARLCHKHVLNRAENFTQAFDMLYSRFMSN